MCVYFKWWICVILYLIWGCMTHVQYIWHLRAVCYYVHMCMSWLNDVTKSSVAISSVLCRCGNFEFVGSFHIRRNYMHFQRLLWIISQCALRIIDKYRHHELRKLRSASNLENDCAKLFVFQIPSLALIVFTNCITFHMHHILNNEKLPEIQSGCLN